MPERPLHRIIWSSDTLRENTTHELIESLHGELIVPVQAYPGKPMYHPETMTQIAHAAQIGGAAVIHCQGLVNISAIKGRVGVPVIDLQEGGREGVYITPNLRHAHACIMAGCDIVAIDATSCPRLDGCTFAETCRILHEESALVMAGCGSLEDAKAACGAGADIISTALAGYTGGRKKSVGPDLELLKEVIAAHPDTAMICEGRIHTLQDVVEAMNAGVFAVIIGTGITHPTSITAWFKDAVKKR